MAMVGLVSGNLRYVTELGNLVERDGFTPVFDHTAHFEITNVSLIDAMLASAAIPVFFRPIAIHDDLYVDAGIREVILHDVPRGARQRHLPPRLPERGRGV